MKLTDKLHGLYSSWKELIEPCKNGLTAYENKDHWDKLISWLRSEYSEAVRLSDKKEKVNILKTLEVIIRTDASNTVFACRNSGLETTGSPLYEVYQDIKKQYHEVYDDLMKSL